MSSDGLLSLRWNNHHTSFMQALATLRNKESYSDITIACDGKFYSVHKLVLSTCSDYFVEIMSRTPCKHPIIVLKDIRHQDFEALLNYMYLGEVNVVQNDLASLIKAAECLKIKGLAVPDESPQTEEDSKNPEVRYGHETKQKKRRYENDLTGTDSYPSSKKSNHKTRESLDSSSSIQGEELSAYDNTAICENRQNNDKDFDGSCREDLQQPSLINEMVIKEENELKYEYADGLRITGTNRNVENLTAESRCTPQGAELRSESQEQLEFQDSLTVGGREDSHNLSSITQQYPLQPQTFEDIVSQAIPGSSLQSDAGQSWDNSQIKRDAPAFHLQGFSEQDSLSPHHHGLQPMGCIEETFPNMRGSICSEGNITRDSCAISRYAIDRPILSDSRMDIDNSRHAREWRCMFPECGYVTDRESWLRQHFRKHTGEKPFSCPFCSFRSAQRGNLNVHIKRVHILDPVSSGDEANTRNPDYISIS